MKRREFLSAMGLGTAGAVLAPGGAAASATATVSSKAPAPMAARMADALCSSYMMNTKIFYANTAYGHTEAVMDLLTELGVRVIRERVTTGTSLGTKNQLYAMPRLADRGVKWHGTVCNLEDWRNASAANKQVMDFMTTRYAPVMGGSLSGLMHSFGGCNEVDGPGRDGHVDPDWAAHARLMQRALYEQAKGNRLTAGIPVAGPSTRTDFSTYKAQQLGDLSQWSELGNGHLYNKGTSPTREIDGHLQILDPCFPGLQKYIFTETGYNNSPQDNLGRTVPEDASAIYAVRGIADYFQRDAMYGRFELLDDPDVIDSSSQARINATANREAHFGLVAMTKETVRESTPDTWRKKPEFYATQRLLQRLADRGPAFSPAPLKMALQSASDVKHVLLQKRNGKHYLLLWRDVEISKTYPEATKIKVGAVQVTVQLETARPFRVWGPNRQDELLRTHSSRRSLDVNVRGDLKIIEIG